MAKKKKGLSKTKRLRKNIKATIRRREAQGWQFDPMDLATVESGNYQQLKALQRDNYRKLYEHAEVMNPETGEVITGRQAQIRGRWKGGIWQDQLPEPIEEPEEPIRDYDSTKDWEEEEDDTSEDIYDSPYFWGEKILEDLKSYYGENVRKDLLTKLDQMIDEIKYKNGVLKTLRIIGQNASRVSRLIQLYIMYYDPETGSKNEPGDPMILQEIRQIIDPDVSLDELEAYSDMEEDWEDV